jgi:hypothetical protein
MSTFFKPRARSFRMNLLQDRERLSKALRGEYDEDLTGWGT